MGIILREEAIVDVAHVMGKLNSNTANDQIFEKATVAKRVKMFDSKQKLRLQPDTIYSSSEGFEIKALEARFFHISTAKSQTIGQSVPLTIVIIKDYESITGVKSPK